MPNPPVCECHGQPMRWNKADRLPAGGHWRCRMKAVESDRRVRLKRYGLTEAQYQAMLAAQDGKCAICGRLAVEERWGVLPVDHNHETGVVRGLICMTCNTTLGRLERYWDEFMSYLGVKCVSM